MMIVALEFYVLVADTSISGARVAPGNWIPFGRVYEAISLLPATTIALAAICIANLRKGQPEFTSRAILK